MRRFAGCAVGVALAICSGVSVSAMPAPVKAPARYRSPSSVTDMVPTLRSHLAGSRRDVPTPTPTDDTPSLVTDAPQQPRPTASAPETTGSSGMGMSAKLAIAVPIFFGGLILFAFIYFIGWGAGRRAWDARARTRRLRALSQLSTDMGISSTTDLRGENWGDESALRRSAEAVEAAGRRGRRGRRNRTPPRRTESGRSIRTLPEYTSEAGSEEIVLLQRERSLRNAGSSNGHERNLSDAEMARLLPTLHEVVTDETERGRRMDDRFSSDTGREWGQPPGYTPETGYIMDYAVPPPGSPPATRAGTPRDREAGGSSSRPSPSSSPASPPRSPPPAAGSTSRSGPSSSQQAPRRTRSIPAAPASRSRPVSRAASHPEPHGAATTVRPVLPPLALHTSPLRLPLGLDNDEQAEFNLSTPRRSLVSPRVPSAPR